MMEIFFIKSYTSEVLIVHFIHVIQKVVRWCVKTHLAEVLDFTTAWWENWHIVFKQKEK